MKRLLKVTTLIIFLSLFLSGCSTTRTMNRIMSSWEGTHINQVVAQWGYPHEEKNFQGRMLYIWHYTKSAYIPQTSTTTGNVSGNPMMGYSYSGSTNTYGGYTISGYCDRILEVDKNGYIVNWQWEGNNCPFGELMEYSKWRKR
ncbi:MAG: hypothetical protein ISS47_05270 [Candidatus Omnitrophica bacterium]|nr:hypothetical protein [Candidatus Omnitrophota bacterium]